MKYFLILLILTGCTQKYIVKNCMRVFDKEGKQQSVWVCEN